MAPGISALFIAVIGGQYLSRSLYGHLDHHIAETLFSTLFYFLYVVALYALKDHNIDFKNYATIQHVRMEYYVAANIALLVAVFVGWAITFAEKDLMQTIKPQKTEKTAKTPAATKNKKTVVKASSSPDWIKVGVAAIVVIIIITFVATSAAIALQTGSNYGKYGGTEKD